MITPLTIILEKIFVLGVELIDIENFVELILRFTLNMGVVLILVRWLYYKTTRRKDYLFTYVLISIIIFLLCYLLSNVKLQTGFALGLFAIFGIMRYRTNQMPIREMTYLFMVIGISAINALANKKVAVVDLIFSNAVFVFVTYGFEKVWLLRHESVKLIIYERVDLLKPDKYNELITDLQMRTGIPKINRIEVGKIDFLRDTCQINMYYYEPGREINQANIEDLNKESGDDD